MPEHPVESILQYHFSNRDLLYEALLAAGAPKSIKNIEGDKHGNKRLALLGDSVLREAILEPWYQTEESIEEGSERVKELGRNKKLDEVAQKSGLVEHIVKNPCQQGRVPRETAASTVEALVGAVYLDSGEDIETVKKILKAIRLY